MSVTCDAGESCKITCEGESCYAIFVHDTKECLTGCGGTETGKEPVLQDGRAMPRGILEQGMAISVAMTGMDRGEASRIVERLSGGRLPAVPYPAGAEPVTLDLRYTTAAAVADMLDDPHREALPPGT